jgi:DNA-binding PadR family transcriptional regulator
MTEQQRPDEDVEGHKKSFALSEEGLEEAVEDDVEGHKKSYALSEDGTEDDVEGHSLNVRRPQ